MNPLDLKPGTYVPGAGTLVSIEDVTPPAPSKTLDYIFEGVSYQGRVKCNGRTLNNLGTWTEWAKESAIEQAKRVRDDLNATPQSDVEVVVVEMKGYSRMRPSSRLDRDRYPFQAIEIGCRRDVPEESESVIWSSKDPDTSPSA